MYKDFDDPEDYVHAKPEDLDWKLRLPKLRKKIASANADIVCLQEISKQSFADDFGTPFQEKHGYDFIVNDGSKKSKVDFSIGIMWKANKFECAYHDFRARATILLLTNKLEAAQCPKCVHQQRACLYHSFFVVSVHLDSPVGGKDNESTRINQLKSVLKRINFCIADTLKLNACTETANVRIVIVGDFNSGVSCPGSKMLQNENEKFAKHQYHFKEAYLEKMRSGDYNLDHPSVDLVDPNLRIKHFPTYCIIDRVYCIDLLFYTVDTMKLVGVSKTMDDDMESKIKWKEKCAERIEEWMQSGKQTNKQGQLHLADFNDIWAAPNQDMPSDHMPICGVFQFENLCEANNRLNEQCRCCLEVVKKKKKKKDKNGRKSKKNQAKNGRESAWTFHEICSF